jgi:hypothetical protein
MSLSFVFALEMIGGCGSTRMSLHRHETELSHHLKHIHLSPVLGDSSISQTYYVDAHEAYVLIGGSSPKEWTSLRPLPAHAGDDFLSSRRRRTAIDRACDF